MADKDFFINLYDDEEEEIKEVKPVRRSAIVELDNDPQADDIRYKNYGEPKRSAKVVTSEREKKRKVTKKKKVLSIVGRCFTAIGVTLLLVLVFLYGICFILIKGPSESAKKQFVCAANETSAMKWLPYVYLKKSEVKSIINSNTMQEIEEGTVSDTNLVVIPTDNQNTDEPDIQLLDVSGKTYRGKLLIVKDPSRVFVGTVDRFYEGTGMVVADICKKYNAIGGVNGGEFVDMGSYSYTAMPVGPVISQGKHIFGDTYTTYNITGITNDNKLVIGKMSVDEALKMGVRDAVHTLHTTGPFLILNGEPLTVPDKDVYGGGMNPRTAIGQRADGAILLLVVDGRQANSMGATFDQLAYIMLEYGAVNAAAMDGGTSTQMYYEGEVVNSPYSPSGPRKCPTAWLVK